MGGLGNTMHYRCTGCGANTSVTHKSKKKHKAAEKKVEEAAAVEPLFSDVQRDKLLDEAFG